MPIEAFKQKLARRTGTGKIRAEAVFGPLAQFEVPRGDDGKIRTGIWDRGMTPGQKVKDGQESDFSAPTFAQMIGNWKRRGEPLAGCYNHQSAYVETNGQPAPALAFYDAICTIENGAVTQLEKLAQSKAEPPDLAELQARVTALLATDENPQPSIDGAWFYRSEVTEMGERLLANFKFISPMFTAKGSDEQGNPIGYVIYDLAFTNTAFQAGCMINFQSAGPAGQPIKETPMAKKFNEEFAKKMGLEGADDDKVKQSFATKCEEAKMGLFEEEKEPGAFSKHAAALEEMAKHYEDAYGEEEGGDEPHITMRKLAAKYRKLGAAEAAPVVTQEPHKEPDGDEAYERKARAEVALFAQRMNVTLPAGASSKEMLETIRLASVPASTLPKLIEEQVRRTLDATQAKAIALETSKKAVALVEAAIEGGYPEENKAALLTFASDPKTYAAAEAMCSEHVKRAEGEKAQLFQRLTAGGAPIGVDSRRGLALDRGGGSGPDVKLVRTQLANFVVEGGRYSAMMLEMADAKEGPIKLQIDAMLSAEERSHPGLRAIAADKILQKQRPELFQAGEDPQLFGM